jgi:D-cysteine desulfhydrase
VGYVSAAIELAAQVRAGELPEPSHVVLAVGSGGTAAGLLAGLRRTGLRSRLVCVLVNDLVRCDATTISRLAARTCRLLARAGAPSAGPVERGRIRVERGWLGAGYGHPTPAGRRAMTLLREREDLELDPVYTAKAVAALLALNRAGRFGAGPVLYWHTYGVARPA